MVIGGKDTPAIADGSEIDTKNIDLKLVETKPVGPGMLLHYEMIK